MLNSVYDLKLHRDAIEVKVMSEERREELFQWKREGEQGFGIDEAIKEAQRCLRCPKPSCVTGCPIQNDIPDFIHAVAQGNIGEAADIIARKSDLPAICGRICPKENQCQGHCIMNRAKKPPIQIGYIESFVADFVGDKLPQRVKKVMKTNGIKVAIIGSGPAGLSAAEDMARAGYEVTVFEANSEPGGLLVAGIPEFRLAKHLVRRKVEDIKTLGVEFICNCALGKEISLEDIEKQGFASIFIGIGAGIPWNLDIAGIKREGVYMSMEILQSIQKVINKGMNPISLSKSLGKEITGEEEQEDKAADPFSYDLRSYSTGIGYSITGNVESFGYTEVYKAEKANLTNKPTIMSQMPTQKDAEQMLSQLDIPIKAGDKMLIIGAGNVAMDVARSSRRMGLDVTVVFRRNKEQMECLPSEYEAAFAEGVKFKYCLQPVEVVGDGKVKALRCEKIEILRDGSPVSSGYFETLPADVVVISIGHRPNREAYETIGQLGDGEKRQSFNQMETKQGHIKCDPSGYIITNEEPYYGMTSREGIFAGGDIVHRPATVVLAMREGRRVAKSMISYLEDTYKKEEA